MLQSHQNTTMFPSYLIEYTQNKKNYNSSVETLVCNTKDLRKFFTKGTHMALNAYQRQILGLKGLYIVEDSYDFKEYNIEQSFKNTRTTIPGVPDFMSADGTVYVAAVPVVTPCIVSTCSYPRYVKLIMRRQERCWIIIHSSTANQLIMNYLTNSQPMIKFYVKNALIASYLSIPSSLQ